MKSTISIILFFVLPFLINGGKVAEVFVNEVKWIEMQAEKKTVINNKILLKKNALLGEGTIAFIYEGILTETNRSVAIKFVKEEINGYCELEMAMFSYLKAYQNESVEKYGIPVVYYYGRWKGYILTAFTKFDKDLLDVATEEYSSFNRNPLNVLMLLRDFVFQSKYLHSHGVRHDDIKPENIMLRGHRSFLIDLNSSSKMMEDNRGGTPLYRCNRFRTGQIRQPIDDYESFLYTMCAVMGNNWIKPEFDNKIRKKQLGTTLLERMIKAFADEVFPDGNPKRFPNYNKLEQMLSFEIKRLHPHGQPKFSWVAADAETTPERNIKDITDPKDINFNRFNYPSEMSLF